MHISWLGSTAFRLQTKSGDSDITIVIDAYRPAAGNFPRSLTPQIALFTRGTDGAINLSGNPFLLATAGEIDSKGVLVTAVQGNAVNQTLLRLDLENMSVGHLGLIAEPLANGQLEALSGVDILCIPIGGKAVGAYDAETAVKIVNTIEPRVVIPMAYRSENDPKADELTPFLKAMGAGAVKPEPKVILKQKDLPIEETRVIVLEKE